MSASNITTIEQLREAFPQLCQDLATAAASEARAGVDLKTPASQASAAEQARILGLVNVHFGAEAGQQFAAIATGGVTVEQYTAIRASLGAAPAAQNPAAQADEEFRKKMLQGLLGASAPGVGAGGGGLSDPATWDEAVTAIQAEKKCSRGVAVRAAAIQYPGLHVNWLKSLKA